MGGHSPRRHQPVFRGEDKSEEEKQGPLHSLHCQGMAKEEEEGDGYDPLQAVKDERVNTFLK